MEFNAIPDFAYRGRWSEYQRMSYFLVDQVNRHGILSNNRILDGQEATQGLKRKNFEGLV